jgi:hypothetical protein
MATQIKSTNEDQEYEIFLNAKLYCVYTFSDHQLYHYKTFPEALAVALHFHQNESRPVLRVYTENNVRYFTMPRDQYQKYLDVYNTLTGQTLKMPVKLHLNPKTKG